MTLQSLLFLIVAGAAFGYSGYRFHLLFRLMKAQQGKAPIRWNLLPTRIVDTAIHVLGQKAVLRKKTIGILHTTIFWEIGRAHV